MTLYRALFALFLALAAIVSPAIAATHAQAAGCTTVWLTAPSWFHNFEAGSSRCIWFNDKSDTGWLRVHRLDQKSLKTIDWLSPHDITRVPPNNGLYKPNADMARGIAAKYNVHLRFAVSNASGEVACTGAWANQVNGNYHPSGRYPGEGVIQIGTGYTSSCMHDRDEVWNTMVHETAHALMERRCPKIFEEARHEHVTDAYAWKFLGATNKAPGNYGFTRADLTRAYEVLHREC